MFHADMSTRHPNVPALEFGHLSVFGIGLEQPTFVGSQQKRLTDCIVTYGGGPMTWFLIKLLILGRFYENRETLQL